MNRKNYPHIAARVFDVPLLIEQSKLLTILDYLGPRLEFDVDRAGSGDMVEYQPPENHLQGMLQTSTDFTSKAEGHYVGNGVAVIPVIGTLVQRSDWMTSMSGMTSYGQIERMYAAAMDDLDVREIVAEYDTPGGEVAGAFDTADRLTALRGKGKRITAVASEFAASAGYLLASTADEIVVPRTGMVGSIGVVAAHYDYSKAIEKRGIAVTFIYAGEKKVNGNPYQPLSESVRAEWQAEVENIYNMFVSTVALNRGLTADQVRGTKAGMFTGAKALEAGLANRVNTFSNEVSNAVLRARNPGYAGVFFGQSNQQENSMSNVNEAEAKARAEAEARIKAEADAKVKAEADAQARIKAEADAKAKAEAEAQERAKSAAVGDRARIKSILECDEAKGRSKLASHIALETDMTLDEARKLLSTSAKEGGNLNSLMTSPGIAASDTAEDKPFIAESAQSVYDRRDKIFNSSQRATR